MTLEEAVKRLRQLGLRLTAPRQKMLEVLLAAGGPLTAEEIRQRAGTAGLAADLSTVYRNLLTFVTADLLEALPGANGEKRYGMRPEGANGARLMCLDCGKLLPLPEADLSQVGSAAARQGFDPQTLTLAAHCSHLCEQE